jgi:hypothetical protein
MDCQEEYTNGLEELDDKELVELYYSLSGAPERTHASDIVLEEIKDRRIEFVRMFDFN